ncbi:hypothetical protein KEM54_002639 [Ascosphaera aggregata]|nr:hypothetical protein KEM54_002639 [Ascosphaera aggregata]
MDSPSRQLMQELSKELEQMRIQSFELKLVKAHERRTYYENLDKIDKSREASYNSALDLAAAKHETVRKDAQKYLSTHLQRQEERRRKQLEEEEEARKLREARLARSKARKEAEEREAREKEEEEEREKQESLKKKEELEKQQQAAEAERLRKAKTAEKEQEEQEEGRKIQRKQAEEKKKSEKEKEKEIQDEKAAPAPAPAPTFGAARRSQQEILNHERYLEIHKNLKELRKWMESQAKANPDLKAVMGDGRRTIKKCAGQLVPDDKKANKTPTQQVAKILQSSLTVTEPSVDICQFIAFPSLEVAKSPTTQVPALFIYLLNMLSKSVIAQLIAESGVKPRSAEPIGIFVAQILSVPDLCFHGTSMIDIFLAKYHVVCPVLFGFYGPEDTEQGKEAIGWWREDGCPWKGSNSPFVAAQVHEERMIGLASGFATLSLRNFSKAKRSNPLPNRYFWSAVAYILEVPPQEVQDTQLYVLTALLKHSAARVVGFWGDYGVDLLRYATVDFLGAITTTAAAAAAAAAATTTKSRSPAKAAAELLRLSWANDKGIFIV